MRKDIVFDSSTAILLAKIQLLGKIAEKLNIIFAETVRDETTKGKESFDSKLINNLIAEGKIKIKTVNQSKVNKLLEDFNIEKGEAEALVLASEKICILATDDGPSIKACRILNIKFMTAIHFLVGIYKKRLLDKRVALEKLKELEKYGRYNYEILKDAKNKLGE